MRLETNISEVIREVDDFGERVIGDVGTAIRRTVALSLPEVRRRSPVDTGQLREGWTTRYSANRAELSNDVTYAKHVEGVENMAVSVVERQLDNQLSRIEVDNG